MKNKATTIYPKLIICTTLIISALTGLAADTCKMTIDAPITTWDEAIPLGNGMLGGLLWGRDNTINLSLDRGDLWDESTPPEILEGNWNFANMRELIAGNWSEFMRRYSNIYNRPAPTKLPGGRLVLTLDSKKKATEFKLQMRPAAGEVKFSDGSRLSCFFHATERVALILTDDISLSTKFIRPDGLNKLNYKPAEFGDEPGMSWPVNIAEEPTPVIRIFPAMPWRWHSAAFRDLRADGGFVVSAKRKNNATTEFAITATVDGELRLRDNFGGAKPKFNKAVKKLGANYVVQLKAGETLTGSLVAIHSTSVIKNKKLRRTQLMVDN